MITNSFPEYRVIIGRVVSIVVAPPTEIGASFPKYFTNNGAHSKAMISRMILESNAIVPNSANDNRPRSWWFLLRCRSER